MSNSLSGNDTVLFGPDPNPGDRLGNYILDRKLGSGGMGQVWKAIHEPTGKPYAIKLLPPIIASNPDAWDQVRRNFDIIENLNHPHICAVKVLDRDPKYGPYLVMAYVEGMTLNKYRQGRTFTPEQVAALLKPVAEALDFAHSRKVIHRDIKHENIMVVLADDGQTITDTYVIDFGLAAESRTVVTQFSQQSAPLAGTLRYMAPELWRGRPPVPASDQYALTVIAYELLAGYFPIDGVDRGIMREAVLNEAVEPIEGQAVSVNAALLKGLAKKPDERFATCMGMLDCKNSTPEQVTSGNSRDRSQRPESGQSTVKYESASLSELQRLVAASDSMAQFTLGKKYRTGDGVAKDSQQAYRLIRSAAESGHAEAQLILGEMSMQGEGTLRSEKEGHRWYRLSAENGWPEAQYVMYINLWYGDDEDSRPEAVEWLQKSAANRYASAADTLAGIYSGLEEVDFIEPDDEQAVYWQQIAMEAYYVDATEKNDASAQYSLGLAYDSSITPGVDEDPSEAAKWFTLAADQGHKRAMHQLAWCYCRGKGVSKDGQRALALLKAAADLGDIDSENAIGLMYQSGYGVKANLETAAKWYRIAVSHGHSAAKHNLKNIGYGDDDDFGREPPKPKGWFDSLFG